MNPVGDEELLEVEVVDSPCHGFPVDAHPVEGNRVIDPDIGDVLHRQDAGGALIMVRWRGAATPGSWMKSSAKRSEL